MGTKSVTSDPLLAINREKIPTQTTTTTTTTKTKATLVKLDRDAAVLQPWKKPKTAVDVKSHEHAQQGNNQETKLLKPTTTTTTTTTTTKSTIAETGNSQHGKKVQQTTRPPRPTKDASSALLVKDFDAFFKAIPERFFEQTENEMMSILETEKEILKMSILTSTAPSTNATNLITDKQQTYPPINGTISPPPSRQRRSAARNAFRSRLIRRSLAVICRRRCVWNNIWHFVKTGIMRENHQCDC